MFYWLQSKHPKLIVPHPYVAVLHRDVLLPDWARYRCWFAAQICDHWLTTTSSHCDGAEQAGTNADGSVRGTVERARDALRATWHTLPYTDDRALLAASLHAAIAPFGEYFGTSHTTLTGESLHVISSSHCGIVQCIMLDALILFITRMVGFYSCN